MALALEDPNADETVDDPLKAKKSLTSLPLSTEYAGSSSGQPNRLELATKAFDTFAKSTAPQYQADLRTATQAAAGKGQIGSGGLRTTYGNLANQRALALDTQRDTLINDAIKGTIDDARYADTANLNRYNAETSRLGTTGNLELAKSGQAIQQSQFAQTLDFQKAQAAIDNAYKTGQLTLAQRSQALAELAQQQQNANTLASLDLQRTAQQQQASQEAARLQLAKDQVAEQARQFGLTQTQQLELAKIADATANRQIDVSSAQGKNALLLELARIMGTSTANIDPNFLAAIAKALGITLPSSTTSTTGTTSTTTTKPSDPTDTRIDENR